MSVISREDHPALVTDSAGYIGRDGEIRDLLRLLASERLVTVVGAPGVGKTRLVRRVMTEAGARRGNEVVFVDLTEVRDPALVGHTIAVHVGLPGGSATPIDNLLNTLRDRRMLLVLDNCEHLIRVCADVASRILEACPAIVLLMTSRQPLASPRERLFPLAPMPVPDRDAPCTLAEIEAFDVVKLFVDRARSVVPSFSVTRDNRDEIARLVRELDGLPLAIELAARWMRSLSVGQLSERLDSQLRFLGAKQRHRSPCTRSLRDTLAWSYDLCSPDERLLWARASVFAGTFDLHAARSVCHDGTLGAERVPEVLRSLVDKSVFMAERHGDGLRYRLLESLREYGAEHLADEQEVRRRHRDHYARLATRLHRARGTSASLPQCHDLRTDHPNFRVALRFCVDTPGEAAAGWRLASNLDVYWQACRAQAEGRDWLDRLLKAGPGDGPGRAEAVLCDAHYAVIVGDFARGTELLDEARELAQHGGARDVAARARYMSAMLATFTGDLGQATTEFAVLVEEFHASGDRQRELASIYHLGWCTAFTGDPRRGREILRDGLADSVEHDELYSQNYLLDALTRVDAEYGTPAEAAATLRQLQHTTAQTGMCPLAGDTLAAIGWVAGRLGDHTRAAVLYGAAETASREHGFAMHALALFTAPHHRHVNRARVALGDSEFRRHHTVGESMTAPQRLTYALDPESTNTRGRRTGRSTDGEPSLSRRELEVADLVRRGLTNQQIAEHLTLSPRTVQTHITHILNKLDFHTRTQIAVWATQQIQAALKA
ncbi:LuxR C-terminal-related transcriptional regulator [Amycolatopsis thailandensis]|uniref:ATP-binding protein n=1 Tax=Amycolatopsis thailandensis TaxID=589330 RepID=UPI0036628FD5